MVSTVAFWNVRISTRDEEEVKPLSRHVPYDILSTVVKYVDFHTLRVFCLANRDLKYEADKLLWRGVHLRFMQMMNARTYLTTMMSILSGERAAYMRELTLTVGRLNEFSTPTINETVDYISTILPLATSLVTLRLETFAHHSPIFLSLAKKALSPSITSVYSNAPLDVSFITFLTSLPQLRYLNNGQSDVVNEFPEGKSLQALEVLKISTVPQARLMQGSCVHELTIGPIPGDDSNVFTTLMKYINASTVPLLKLTVQLANTPHPPSSILFRETLQNLPELRFLKLINHPRIVDTHENSSAMSVLGSLTHLEELIWHGADLECQRDIMDVSNVGAPSLRRLRFAWYLPSKSFTREYVRNDRGGSWALVLESGGFS